MVGGDPLLDRARKHPGGLKFRDFERLLKNNGWRLDRQEGSHRIYVSPGGQRLPIQPTRAKDAKDYQVRQFIEQHDKEHAGGAKR